ncbi:hypothetical protein [Oceanispirochaeta sp.]|jgi:hypothetical protein|uniref:hypothetical protein n=1 Tax=Oceanispirochaeta sp. TaxID=2035350 RepID=UPI00262FB9ED|nr:hypothetical protein [Oceanispirochaeta sp.]MDA3955426.1 hypothetical protein [Oceanispirochaeta sp.]
MRFALNATQITNLKEYTTLVKDIQSVLDTLIPVELDVQNRAGLRFYNQSQ